MIKVNILSENNCHFVSCLAFFSNNFRIGFLILGHFEGGHFDLADRMFHSVAEAWHSASKNNMADVRELIPEFFYLPG